MSQRYLPVIFIWRVKSHKVNLVGIVKVSYSCTRFRQKSILDKLLYIARVLFEDGSITGQNVVFVISSLGNRARIVIIYTILCRPPKFRSADTGVIFYIRRNAALKIACTAPPVIVRVVRQPMLGNCVVTDRCLNHIGCFLGNIRAIMVMRHRTVVRSTTPATAFADTSFTTSLHNNVRFAVIFMPARTIFRTWDDLSLRLDLPSVPIFMKGKIIRFGDIEPDIANQGDYQYNNNGRPYAVFKPSNFLLRFVVIQEILYSKPDSHSNQHCNKPYKKHAFHLVGKVRNYVV